jgi:hypothetical protein
MPHGATRRRPRTPQPLTLRPSQRDIQWVRAVSWMTARKRRNPRDVPRGTPEGHLADLHRVPPLALSSYLAPIPYPERQAHESPGGSVFAGMPQDVAETIGMPARAGLTQNGRAYVISQLMDTGNASWVRAFFHSFARPRTSPEQLAALEAFRSQAALIAFARARGGGLPKLRRQPCMLMAPTWRSVRRDWDP